MNNYVYIVGKQDFTSGIIYEPVRAFLYEESARKYCEQINEKYNDDVPYAYQQIKFSGLIGYDLLNEKEDYL